MKSTVIPQYDTPEHQDKLAIFDGDYLKDIEEFVNQWKSQRIILVASKTLYTASEHVKKLEAALGDKIFGKKIGIGSHTPYADVLDLAHLIQNSNADCVICIGSGSYSDGAKIATKLAATLPKDFSVADVDSIILPARGYGLTKPATCRLILVPTSLSAGEWNGTGSCTAPNGKKQHFGCGSHAKGSADVIICDPTIAATSPRKLWMSSGARCIDHCVETVTNESCTPEDESHALEGLGAMLIGLQTYAAGNKADESTWLHGISAAQRGSRDALAPIILSANHLGPSHAIGHQLGGVADVLHGETSAILLAPTLRFTAVSKAKVFARSKSGQDKVLGVFNDKLEWDEKSAADAVERFMRELGLPTRLSQVGVTSDEVVDKVAERTLTDIWGGGDPQITDKADVRQILDSVR